MTDRTRLREAISRSVAPAEEPRYSLRSRSESKATTVPIYEDPESSSSDSGDYVDDSDKENRPPKEKNPPGPVEYEQPVSQFDSYEQGLRFAQMPALQAPAYGVASSQLPASPVSMTLMPVQQIPTVGMPSYWTPNSETHISSMADPHFSTSGPFYTQMPAPQMDSQANNLQMNDFQQPAPQMTIAQNPSYYTPAPQASDLYMPASLERNDQVSAAQMPMLRMPIHQVPVPPTPMTCYSIADNMPTGVPEGDVYSLFMKEPLSDLEQAGIEWYLKLRAPNRAFVWLNTGVHHTTRDNATAFFMVFWRARVTLPGMPRIVLNQFALVGRDLWPNYYSLSFPPDSDINIDVVCNVLGRLIKKYVDPDYEHLPKDLGFPIMRDRQRAAKVAKRTLHDEAQKQGTRGGEDFSRVSEWRLPQSRGTSGQEGHFGSNGLQDDRTEIHGFSEQEAESHDGYWKRQGGTAIIQDVFRDPSGSNGQRVATYGMPLPMTEGTREMTQITSFSAHVQPWPYPTPNPDIHGKF